MSVKMRRHLRRQAFINQHCRCFYCHLPIWQKGVERFAKRLGLSLEQARLSKCTAEHLQARSDGGRDIPGNIAAACAWCNHHRHAGRVTNAPDPEIFREEVRWFLVAGLHPLACLVSVQS